MAPWRLRGKITNNEHQIFPSCAEVPEGRLHWLLPLYECLPYAGHSYQGG